MATSMPADDAFLVPNTVTTMVSLPGASPPYDSSTCQWTLGAYRSIVPMLAIPADGPVAVSVKLPEPSVANHVLEETASTDWEGREEPPRSQ